MLPAIRKSKLKIKHKEDTLTSAIFQLLMYLPRDVFKEILEETIGDKLGNLSVGQFKGCSSEYIFAATSLGLYISEQNRIVQKVEGLLSMCAALEAEVQWSSVDAAVLMQAVLQEAFG